MDYLVDNIVFKTTYETKISRKWTKAVEHTLGLETRPTNLKNGDKQQMLKRWALYITAQQITNNNSKTTIQLFKCNQQTAKQ